MVVEIPRQAQRWISFGPYYAMFPIPFALQVIERYTEPGDAVLDPFAGRGTSIAAAAATGRTGFGVEINPVGWMYASVKLAPADPDVVVRRLREITREAEAYVDEAERLPEFYHWAFSPPVLRFLLSARGNLRWRDDPVDRTLMAFILLYLHGKRGQALSNQMRQQKSMAPDYSVRWWKTRGMTPPDVDPVAFLERRIRWRYERGTIAGGKSEVALGDAREILPEHRPPARGYRLLLTSPPYSDVTSYYYDNWLRYWMLGGPELPNQTREAWTRDSRHSDRSRYKALLRTVFLAAAEMMSRNAIVYVRTDAREFTRQATIEALSEAFPGRNLMEVAVPVVKKTQTVLFNSDVESPGEIDIILH